MPNLPAEASVTRAVVRRVMLGAVIVALCGATSAVSARSTLESAVADLLWLPTASVVDTNAPRFAHADGTAAVAFRLPDANRTALVVSLREHFKAARWRERDEVTVNTCCGTATSFKQGWRHLCSCVVQTNPDGTPIPPRDVAEWNGEWQDSHGNRIGYNLMADGLAVRGYAAYSPKGMARRQPETPLRGSAERQKF